MVLQFLQGCGFAKGRDHYFSQNAHIIRLSIEPPKVSVLSVMDEPNKEALQTIILSFRQRASSLRRYSTVVIVLIVTILFSGILLFVLAGYLGAKEGAFADAQRQVLIQAAEDVSKKLNEQKAAGPLSEAQAQALADKSNREIQGNLIYSPYLDTISTISTRIGTIILLLFLVQILVPLYKYNVRLSSYYDARADAIELFSLNIKEVQDDKRIEDLMFALTPRDIDFSPSPQSPSEQVIELAKEILSSKLSR